MSLELRLYAPDFVVLLYHHIFVRRFVTGRIRVGVIRHVGGDGMAGDEAGEGTDFREQTDFVHLELHT